MLSPQATCRLMSSRMGRLSSNREMALANRDRFAPGYDVDVEYLGRLEIAVTGRFTGRLYRFSPIHTVQRVDPRDAFHLLESGPFGVAS